jgi:hypothetical protein
VGAEAFVAQRWIGPLEPKDYLQAKKLLESGSNELFSAAAVIMAENGGGVRVNGGQSILGR